MLKSSKSAGNGQNEPRSNQAFIVSNQNNTRFPNLNNNNINNDNNVKNQYNNNQNNVIRNSSASIVPHGGPPVTVYQKKGSSNVVKNGFKFNRMFLIIPIVAFIIVAIIAVACGIVFGVIYRPNYKYSEIPKSEDNTTKALVASPITTLQTTTTLSTLSPQSTIPTTTIGLNRNTCGIQPVKPNLSLLRIIRGQEALSKSWPWIVSIGYNGPRRTILHACGGTLVNRRTVVTASHCLESNSVYALAGSPVQNSASYADLNSMIRIYVGVTKQSTDKTAARTYGVTKVLMHPEFDSVTFKNDIAIITLDRDVPESIETGYLCVDEVTPTNPGTKVYAIGWGFTEKNWYKASDSLMQVSFPIKTKNGCGISYIPVFQFCAGDETLHKDTCNGDSGGPLMTYVNNRFVFTGIVSNGDAACTGRGIYTNVALYYNWILQNSN